jgi:hypothetical protein
VALTTALAPGIASLSPTSTIRPRILPFSGHFGPWWRRKRLIERERAVRKRL